MFNKSTKSAIFMVVAVLMLVAVMLTACNGNAFEPVAKPTKADPQGNGGNAIIYGEWLYYVNGYQSNSAAENTYEKIDARVGAIARIKLVDLESLFAVYDDPNVSSGSRSGVIADIVDEKAEIVVPKFYYSANTTTTQINGIYIFNDRLYMLTPNDELTAGGNSQTSQSVLTSFGLDGSDEQRHYTFTNNAAQIMLNEVGDKLVATYIMGTTVGCIDVKAGAELAKIEETSSATIDVAGKAVFYIDSDNAICKLNAGATESKVVVANDKDSKVTYTISNVNNGYVYYTKAYGTNKDIDALHVYYATETASGDEAVAWKSSAPTSNWYGYNNTIVYAKSKPINNDTLYGIYLLTNSDGSESKTIVNPVQNDNSITFNRIEGDILYYTCDSVAYMVDLSKDEGSVAIGRNLSSASGWSVPDVITIEGQNSNYVITLSSGSVTAYKFDRASKLNDPNGSVTLTIVAPAEEEK